MLAAESSKPKDSREEMDELTTRATEHVKAKSERLRHLKERHENYIAEQKENDETDEERTEEL